MAERDKLYYKTCREQAGLTQEQAVILLGISEVSTLSKYENGRLPVSPELARDMVRVYRTPRLASWHMWYTNEALREYLPELSDPITDGDAALLMDLSCDSITETKDKLKAMLRDGAISAEEVEELKRYVHMLRDAANKILSAAAYLESRNADTKESDPDGR